MRILNGGNNEMARTTMLRRYATGIFALGLLLAACGEDVTSTGGDSSNLSGSISVDGSSTVGPLTAAAAELFQVDNPEVKITVGVSGTGGGFVKLCLGEIDMEDASRPIKEDDETEAPACKANGIAYEEIRIANDGIALVTSKDNKWAKCLTTAQLNKIWAADSKVTNWKQVDSAFPDEKLTLFGAGTSSGTFDFFTKAVNGEEGSSRSDYNATEDDNVTVQGVSGDKGALGYFGLSYYEANKDKLNVLAVNGGDGCVSPSTTTVQNGDYSPLSRPLFVYPSDALLNRPEGLAFVKFYVKNSENIALETLFVPLTEAQLQTSLAAVQTLAASGTTTKS